MRRLVLAAALSSLLTATAHAFQNPSAQSATPSSVYGPNGYVYGPGQSFSPYAYGATGYGGMANQQPGTFGGGQSTFSVTSPGFYAQYGGYRSGLQITHGWPRTGYSGLNYYSVGGPYGGGSFGSGGFGAGGYGPLGGYSWRGGGAPLSYGPLSYGSGGYYGPGVINSPPGQFDPAWGAPQYAPPYASQYDPRSQGQAGNPFNLTVPGEHDEPLITPSTLEAQRRSIRLVAQGDEWFGKQNYLQAHARYKQAASTALDRAEPRFRIGYALVALGHFASAAAEFRRGLRLDPTWPVKGQPLDQLYGERNALAKDSMMYKAAEWVSEDVRDPDRLFVMGVLLFFSNDPDRAQVFFQAADVLLGSPPYLQPFLKPTATRRQAQPQAGRPAGSPAVPQRPAVEPEAPGPDPNRDPDAKPVAADPVAKPALEGPVLVPPGVDH